MNALTETETFRVTGPKAPATDMRPRLIGVSLGTPILAGIGDDKDNVAVPCLVCTVPRRSSCTLTGIDESTARRSIPRRAVPMAGWPVKASSSG
jgi:hypothetical protein